MPTGVQNEKAKRKAPADYSTTPRCGTNVFEVIGLPDPDLYQAKADLVIALQDCLVARKLSEAKAAELLKVEPGRFKELLKGQTPGFTIDRLIRMLNKLGRRVELTVCTRPDGAA